MENGKKVIGILVAGIADTFSIQTCRGVMKAAQDKDINLVIIPGKYIYRDTSSNPEIMYEYQYNTLFSYAENKRFDALLITPDNIACHTNKQRKEDFLKQFSDVPKILISSKMDGYLSVNYDSYEGIKDGLEYLIKKLHCKKIAMFGGSDDITDARERKEAFFKILDQNNIAHSEDSFLAGDLTHFQAATFEKYLEKHPDLEAVFCVNDDTALSVYEAMKNKNLVPGKDIYVMGYDNTIEGAKAAPSLSTVMADASKLGERALELALDLLDGKLAHSEVIPNQFLKRDSFGEEVSFEQAGFLFKNEKASFETYFNSIFYRFDNQVEEQEMREKFYKAMNELAEVFEAETRNEDLFVKLNTLTDLVINTDAVRQADADRMMDFIENIGQALLKKYVDDQNAKSSINKLTMLAYRKIIHCEEQTQGNMMASAYQRNYDVKRFIANTMNFEKGNDQNYQILLKGLEWLEIGNAQIFTFAKPVTHLFNEIFTLPDKVYLKAELTDHVASSVTKNEQETGTENLFRNLWGKTDEQTKVMFPIFSNEILYGALICDMTEKIFEAGELLANQISASVKMLSLLKMNEDIQMQYEENIRILRENNISLDTMAKTDSLTGLLNRRGFMSTCQGLRDECSASHQNMLIAYIDMNNLKIINDRFGHDDGDFALDTIGKVLRKEFPEAILGRLGGDEFSLACKYDSNQDGADIVHQIYQAFTQFNENSSKPYLVTVSVGTYVIAPSDQIEMQDALVLADEKLYFEKMNRTKNVLK